MCRRWPHRPPRRSRLRRPGQDREGVGDGRVGRGRRPGVADLDRVRHRGASRDTGNAVSLGDRQVGARSKRVGVGGRVVTRRRIGDATRGGNRSGVGGSPGRGRARWWRRRCRSPTHRPAG